MKNKKINGCDVGIVFSIVGIVASIIVIIFDIVKKESFGVGIGLVIFCFLSLFTNIKNKKKRYIIIRKFGNNCGIM